VLGAVVGSALMLLVTALLSVPVGVLAALYLEEFAPRNRFTDLIEVNINNLAAVPSIVYGLLGLALFINWLGLPRATPIVGGLVLALMALADHHHRHPIVAEGGAALDPRSGSGRGGEPDAGGVPARAAAGHAGVLTGTIIALAHALGETAPLLMIGMVAFKPRDPGRLRRQRHGPAGAGVHLENASSAPSTSAPPPPSWCCWCS
jgi:phosphate transport system permease protein